MGNFKPETCFQVTFQKKDRLITFVEVEALDGKLEPSPEHGAAAEPFEPSPDSESDDQPSEQGADAGDKPSDDVNKYTAKEVKYASGLRRRLGYKQCCCSPTMWALPGEVYGASS